MMGGEARYIPPADASVYNDANRHSLESRVRVKVDVIPLAQQIGDTLVPQGLHIVDVPASDMPHLLASVRDEVKWEQAVEQYERDKRAWMEERLGQDRSEERIAHLEKQHPMSPSATYHRMFYGEPLGYLRSLEILEDHVPAIGTARERREIDATQALVDALSQLLSQQKRARGGKSE